MTNATRLSLPQNVQSSPRMPKVDIIGIGDGITVVRYLGRDTFRLDRVSGTGERHGRKMEAMYDGKN